MYDYDIWPRGDVVLTLSFGGSPACDHNYWLVCKDPLASIVPNGCAGDPDGAREEPKACSHVEEQNHYRQKIFSPWVTFRLSSIFLKSASSTFREKLEAKGRDPKTCLYYIRDKFKRPCSAQAMVMVMNILHNRASKNPDKLNLRQLYQMAEIVEHYDLQHVLRPWVRDYMNQLVDFFPQVEPTSKLQLSWIYVSKVVGHAEIFERAVRNILYTHPTVQENTHVWAFTGSYFIVEKIDKRRRDLMDFLDSTLEALVSDYENNQPGDGEDCAEECRSAHVRFFASVRDRLAGAGDSRVSLSDAFEMFNLETGKIGIPPGDEHICQCQERRPWESRLQPGEVKTRYLEALELIRPNSDKIMDGLRLSELTKRKEDTEPWVQLKRTKESK